MMLSRIKTTSHFLIRTVKENLPPFNFIAIHYTYFIGTCLISSLIFWGSSTPSRSITYHDSLFLIASAMTEAGLNTVNLSQLNTFQQWLLWFHILIGSSIFVSAFVLQVRKAAFESRFKAIIKSQKEERKERRRSHSVSKQRSTHKPRFADGPYDESAFESRHSQPRDPANEISITTEVATAGKGAQSTNVASRSGRNSMEDNGLGVVDESVQSEVTDHITFSDKTSLGTKPLRHRMNTVRLSSEDQRNTSRSSTLIDAEKPQGIRPHEFIKSEIVGRNSQFHGLTREERETLGGVEYRAIKLLSYIVPIYFVSWQFFSCLGLGAYMSINKAELIRANGINPW